MRLELPKSFRLTTWGLIFLFFAIIVASFIFKVEITVKGEVRTLPQENIWNIQSKMDGYIAEFYIREGQKVNKGDILFKLKSDVYSKNIEYLNRSLHELKCVNTSLDFLLKQPINKLSIELKLSQEKFNACETFQTTIQHKNLLDKLHKLNLEKIQYKAQIERLKEEKELTLEILKITEEELNRKKSLLNKKLVSTSSFGETQKEYLQLKQRLSEVNTSILSIEHNIEQSHKNIDLEISGQRYLWVNEKASVFQNINEKETLLENAIDELENSIIRSPIEGIVDKKEINGVGDFVSAQSNILSIVPYDGKLIARVYFKNRDIGLIYPNQKSWIKLDAFPIERYELIKGKVLRVSSQSILKNDEWNYFVDVELEKQYVERNNVKYQLKSGMTGEADIIVGKRRIIAFLFEPIFRSFHEAAKEP